MTATAKNSRLDPAHLADLHRSGLDDDTIRRCRFRSTDDADEVRRLLNWDRPGTLGSCLVIPYFHADGTVNQYTRLKPSKPRKSKKDGKPVKYEAPKGSANRAYFPPGRTVEALGDPSHPLLITEGEKKAARADQEGFACVGLAGVYAWQQKRARDAHGKPHGERKLISDLEAITWTGRQVFVVFDSDAVSNDNVRWAEWHLARALAAKGAVVKVVRLPQGEDGAKVGLDDYLCCPDADLQTLLDAASEPQRPESATDAPPMPVPTWPAPPDPVVYHGLAGDFVRAIEPHSEADPVGLLVQLLVGFGSALGHTAHFRAEEDRHYLNEFTALVGPTSKGRKGSSQGQVRRVLEPADDLWAKERIQSGLSSGEGLVWAVRDPIITRQAVKEKGRITGHQEVETDPGVSDKRLLIHEPEFASVLKQTERQGNILSAILRQAWDSGNLRTLTKNNPARATDAHISLVGHITLEEIRRYLSATETANGFANRFLWLCVRRSKQLPEGGRPDEELLRVLGKRLAKALEFGRKTGEMTRDGEARAVWHAVYGPLSEGKPGLAGALLARAEAHVMRLACLYAVLDLSALVRLAHLKAALGLWDYVECSVRYIFGDSTGDPLADEILRLLRAAKKQGLTRTELMGAFGRNQSSERIGRALGVLAEHGLAIQTQRKTPGEPGRPAEVWHAKDQT